MFLGCKYLMCPPWLSCTVSELSYRGRLPSVQWHGKKIVTSWNCSKQDLWIILIKILLISGERPSCWVFQMYFLGVLSSTSWAPSSSITFKRRQTSLKLISSDVPLYNSKHYRWINRRSTAGKRKQRCFLGWTAPLVLKMNRDCRRKPNFKPFTQPIFCTRCTGLWSSPTLNFWKCPWEPISGSVFESFWSDCQKQSVSGEYLKLEEVLENK